MISFSEPVFKEMYVYAQRSWKVMLDVFSYLCIKILMARPTKGDLYMRIGLFLSDIGNIPH